MTLFRRIFKILNYFLLLFFAAGLLCYYTVDKSSEKFIFENYHQIPACKTGIVLGTSKRLANGTENLYFTYRMDAAEKLFRAGKVKYLILSGDNRANHYNEPKDMQTELMRRGIPDSCLVPDYAGLRTFDSMVRCKMVFGQDSVIVISQQFHNARAVYISRHIGLVCFGYNAKKVTTQNQTKIKLREFFSRIKCLMDFYLLNTKPKHLGPKIKIT